MSAPLRRRTVLLGALAAAAAGCGAGERAPTPTGSATRRLTASPVRTAAGSSGPAAPTRPAPSGPADIAARATVPVLCWHQLRNWTAGDSAYDRAVLICPPARFRAQLDTLLAHGYTAISADQYLAHLTTAAPLPAKPVLLSFDDSQGSQITIGLPELGRRGLTATFFVMTVPLGKPRWMSTRDVRTLADEGMTVGAHTWDHQRADRYTGSQWEVQLVRPKAELERIVGRPVDHFAYPYGAWGPADFPHLAAAGYRTAFQLAGRPDRTHPLLTLPRMLVGSSWTPDQLLVHLR